MQSTGIRRTTVYLTPEDRTRLAELVRQIALSDPESPQDCTMSEAIRGAVDYMLCYAFVVHLARLVCVSQPFTRMMRGGYGRSIICLHCGLTSCHPEDVRQRYCYFYCEFHYDKEIKVGSGSAPPRIRRQTPLATGPDLLTRGSRGHSE
jgi:hypothetical protein